MSSPTIICPCCGESFDPLAVAQGQDLGELVGLLAGFGEHRALIRDYVALFKAKPGASLRLSTQLKLARELAQLWRSARFQFDGQTYDLPRGLIAEALHETVKAGPSALKNHNYLKKIMVGKATAADAAREGGRGRSAAPPEPEFAGPGRKPSLAEAAECLAAAYARPRRGLDAATRGLEGRLIEHGVDVGLLADLAAADQTKNFAGRGPELLRRCAAGGQDPAAVGNCLPGKE